MDAINAIDISSSDDSDLREIDEYRDESPLRDSATSAVTITNPRILPPWALQSSSNITGNNVPSRKAPSPKRPFSSRGNSPSFNSHVHGRSEKHSFTRDNLGASPSQTTRNHNNYERHSSQEALKRILPPSFQPAIPNIGSNSLVENVGGSQIREAYGKSHQSGWSSAAHSKNHVKDHFNGGERFMSENRGSRVLPPSLSHGKYGSASPFVGANDPLRLHGVGEEKAAGTDERIVYQAALQDLNQPKVEATLPGGILSVSLLRHQKIALAWMLQKETTGNPCLGGILADDQGLGKTISMIALIQMQKLLQEKSKQKGLCKANTEALNLDDDDDVSIVVPDEPKQTEVSDDYKVVPEGSSSIPKFRSSKPPAGTLIVCPASILQQWAQEIDEKVSEEAKLSVLVYHGSTRTKDPYELAKHDVVLTTYTIVTKEVPKKPLVDDDEEQNNGEKYGLSSEFSISKKRKKVSVNGKGKKGRKGLDVSAFEHDNGTLANVRWTRVILDEAQTIKNHRTQMARACCSLKARTRWCLSGTPIQNAIDELYSYFRFLRYEPYILYKNFCHALKFPIARDPVRGYKKLQAVLRATMLRRTKGTLIDGEPIITLPPKTINLKKVNFSSKERAFYRRLEADSRSQFKRYAAAGTVKQNYASILLMLLRLRQACDHPLLAKGFSSDFSRKFSTEMAKGLPRQMVFELLKLLDTSSAICSLCADPPEDAVVTMCGHVFCYQCISDFLTSDDNTCPASACKEQIGPDIVFSKTTLKRRVSHDVDDDPSSSDFEESDVLHSEYVSSKINAVLEILESHSKPKSPSPQTCNLVRCNGDTSSSGKEYQELQADGPIKTIIFSQWTTMLDLLQFSLERSDINYRRLDGTMSLPARDRAVKEFNTKPEVTVMLMSLKAGNLGLNMVAACHVILLDLWWNPTTEDQAVDRAHRIGQTRPVTVSRLTVTNTVEDRILALQEEKRKMVASAFGEDHSGGSAARLTVEDLRYLFNLDGQA